MNNTQSVSATPDRRRRRVTRALLVLTLTLGSIAVTARPVDAAGYVYTCYQRFGQYPWLVSGFTVELVAWNPTAGYRVIDQSHTNADGCALFFVPPQYRSDYVRTQISHFALVAYRGWSYDSYLWWPPHGRAYTITELGFPELVGWAWPGDDFWYLPGVFWCEPSFPISC